MLSDGRAPNVRISAHTHEVLRQLSEQENLSMQALLDKAVERYRRERFMEAANEDYRALRRDSKAWKQELQEREVWEQSISDGLDKK